MKINEIKESYGRVGLIGNGKIYFVRLDNGEFGHIYVNGKLELRDGELYQSNGIIISNLRLEFRTRDIEKGIESIIHRDGEDSN